ncbi:hypothetical protein BC833DRAFT_603635 [Globomyces pollinis-pini]|nr:hypothetical protein BC833DRAFT_603635 [Globomyces pollinis-pini]
MLSNKTSDDQEQSLYVRNYKPTDIFGLNEEPQAPRRDVIDRNRSTVFDRDPVSAVVSRTNSKKDFMASDIFFGGNSPAKTRFGSYEPSGAAPRRHTPRDSSARQTPATQIPFNQPSVNQAPTPVADVADSHAEARNDYQNHHEQEHSGHEQDNYSANEYSQAQSDYNQAKESYDYEQHNFSAQQPISSVFESEAEKELTARGARRHFQQRHQSDIFNQDQSVSQQTSRERRAQVPAPEERHWVPSVKQGSRTTSFSNIFGDCPDIDRENREALPRRVEQKQLDQEELLSRVSGLSSSNLNRLGRGKGRRSIGGNGEGVGSQIWF